MRKVSPASASSMIYKSNSLISASYHLTVIEQYLVLHSISRIRRGDEEITDDVLYKLHSHEFAEIFGSCAKTAYRDLSDAVERLKRREVRIILQPNSRNKRPVKLVTNWFQSVCYHQAQGMVEVRFAKDILPYLASLTTNFTRYPLADIVKMTSSHAIRIYEMIAQFGDTGRFEISVEELRDRLELGDAYPSIKDFKRNVIDIAIRQIKECAGIEIKYDQRKLGRIITHMIFTYKRVKPVKAPLKAVKPAKGEVEVDQEMKIDVDSNFTVDY